MGFLIFAVVGFGLTSLISRAEIDMRVKGGYISLFFSNLMLYITTFLLIREIIIIIRY